MFSYCPTAGILLIMWGQRDLLAAIQRGGTINIKARCLDFLHWTFLLTVMVSQYTGGSANVSWFLSTVCLLCLIGWQIGLGVGRQWLPSGKEKITGIVLVCLTVCAGCVIGYVRASDSSRFGFGWAADTAGCVAAPAIVFFWIMADVRTISKKARDYPRRMFIKGLVNNGIILAYWFHVM